MKAFLAALTVFALVLCASILHALCITHITDRLNDMEASFPGKEKEENCVTYTITEA